MNYRYLFPGMFDYPPGLDAAWTDSQLPVLTVAGNTGLLRESPVCLLCSSEIPADLVLPSFDLALRLRDAGVPIGGGFQGEVEGVCLSVLLGGSGPVIVCPARSLDAINPSASARDRIAAGRLAYVSSERPTCRRPTVHAAMRRNELLLGLADRLIVLSAPPGSRALRSGAAFLERGRPVACFDHWRNRDLLLLGAVPIPPYDPALLPMRLRRSGRGEVEPDPIRSFLGETSGPFSQIEPVGLALPKPGYDPAAAPRATSPNRASRAYR